MMLSLAMESTTGASNPVRRAGKNMPAMGIYVPPAARLRMSSTPQESSLSSTNILGTNDGGLGVNAKTAGTKPKRPDMQVYVPRARRVATSETSRTVDGTAVTQDETSTTKNSGSNNKSALKTSRPRNSSPCVSVSGAPTTPPCKKSYKAKSVITTTGVKGECHETTGGSSDSCGGVPTMDDSGKQQVKVARENENTLLLGFDRGGGNLDANNIKKVKMKTGDLNSSNYDSSLNHTSANMTEQLRSNGERELPPKNQLIRKMESENRPIELIGNDEGPNISIMQTLLKSEFTEIPTTENEKMETNDDDDMQKLASLTEQYYQPLNKEFETESDFQMTLAGDFSKISTTQKQQLEPKNDDQTQNLASLASTEEYQHSKDLINSSFESHLISKPLPPSESVLLRQNNFLNTSADCDSQSLSRIRNSRAENNSQSISDNDSVELFSKHEKTVPPPFVIQNRVLKISEVREPQKLSLTPQEVEFSENVVTSADKHQVKPIKSAALKLRNVSLNLEEVTWDALFDENGDCLDPTMMDELTRAVGKVQVDRPSSDYSSFDLAHDAVLAERDYSHVLEVYGFPVEFRTEDLMAILTPLAGRAGCDLKWVDDTHALAVFSNSQIAAEVLSFHHPLIQTRPLSMATSESKAKARRATEFLRPYRARPETCAALAKRLVSSALGVRLNQTKEEREREMTQLREAREKKKLAARLSEEAWEGKMVSHRHSNSNATSTTEVVPSNKSSDK